MSNVKNMVVNALKTVFVRPWTDLRGVSNSNAAKSTILIPLIGYWIIFNENIFSWLQLAHQLGGHPASDQIRVRLLYFGLCTIAGGTFIYAWRCPPEIKKYGDYKDYANGDGPAMTKNTMNEIERALKASGYGELEGAIQKNDLLEVHFHDLNKSDRCSRIAVTVLFGIGFTILTVLSLRVFLTVLWQLVGG